MREMLALQPRFEVHKGRRALNFLEHRRFRAAYDFMMLRAENGDIGSDIAQFWTDVQKQDADQRLQSFEIGRQSQSEKKRRGPRRRKSARASQP